ncbi:MAG: Fur family transcriptional regulator [Pseudomonadota bacterium]
MPDAPAPFAPHDHAACAAGALEAARAACAAQGLRLTPARERVLTILLESHAALGAYDVLERLRADGFGAAPPMAYRALDFLTEHGFAHRIEKLNAFVACGRLAGDATGAPAFLICRACRQVAETSAAPALAALAPAADALGFRPERVVVEIEGLCPACAAA